MSVAVSVLGHPVTALVDTGASVSLLSSGLVNKLSVPFSDRPCPTVVGVSGFELNCLGVVSLPVVAQSVALSHNFVVADIFQHDVILGSDFLLSSGCIIDLASSVLRCGSECLPLSVPQLDSPRPVQAPPAPPPTSSPPSSSKPEQVRACVASTVILQPNHAVHLPCSLSSCPATTGDSLVTTLPSFCEKYPGLSMSSPVVSLDNVVLEVVNWSAEAVTLYAGTHVGTVDPVDVVENPAAACSVHAASSPPSVDPSSTMSARISVIDKYLTSECSHLCPSDLATLRSLLVQYHDVFVLLPDDAGYCDLSPHHIDTKDASPIKQQARRLPFHQRQPLQRLLSDLLDKGVIRESASPWAAPIVLVKKTDGSLRLCVDYRKLNAVTVPDAYPLPRISDTLDSFSGCSVFSTLDLATGYWQLAMSPEDQSKTAFTTPLGLYEFTVMPMGCCNGPATFQRVMERVLSGLLGTSTGPVTRVFFDDIAVASGSTSSSVSQLAVVFDRLRSANLKLKLRKCVFLRPQAKFLGVDVSGEGIHTSPSKTTAVADWPQPKDAADVRSFLGLATYYRRFVPRFAHIAAPLHALTAKGAKFHWSPACQAAFRRLKDRLTTAPVLGYPDFSPSAEPFVLDTDASACGMGAVLSQRQKDGDRVIAYGSKLFSKAQRNYSVTEQKLLAVVFFTNHFRHYLLGVPFTIRTDHQALKWLKSLPEPTGRKARWLETLAEYTFTIVHRPGRQHSNADALSRRAADVLAARSSPPSPVSSVSAATLATPVCAAEHASPVSVPPPDPTPSVPVSFPSLPAHTPAELRAAQLLDPDIATALQWYDSDKQVFHRPSADSISGCSRSVHRYASEVATLILLDDVLYRRPDHQSSVQFVVPYSLQDDCISSIHTAPAGGHFGLEKTLQKCQQRFFWPGQSSTVRLFVQACDVCATSKKTAAKPAPLQSVTAGYPGQLVAMDLVGPFPTSDRRNKYILVCVDYFTRWPEAYTLPDMTSTTVAKAFIDGWISRFGVPDRIHSDQGPQFESSLFAELCNLLQVRKSRTTPYHPAGDGLVERMNRTLITTLRTYAHDHPTSWDEHLQLALLAYRTAVQKSTNFTPSQLMFGREIRLPPDIIYGLPPTCHPTTTHAYARALEHTLRDVYHRARQHDNHAHRYQKKYYDRRARDQCFHKGDRVWLLDTVLQPGESSKLHRPWKGPFIVTKIDGTSHDIVPYTSPDRPAKRVHFNRLKLCNSSLPPPAMRADDNDHVDLPPPEPPDAASQETFHWPDIDDPIPFHPAPPLVYHGPINRAHLRRNAGRPLRYRN